MESRTAFKFALLASHVSQKKQEEEITVRSFIPFRMCSSFLTRGRNGTRSRKLKPKAARFDCHKFIISKDESHPHPQDFDNPKYFGLETLETKAINRIVSASYEPTTGLQLECTGPDNGHRGGGGGNGRSGRRLREEGEGEDSKDSRGHAEGLHDRKLQDLNTVRFQEGQSQSSTLFRSKALDSINLPADLRAANAAGNLPAEVLGRYQELIHGNALVALLMKIGGKGFRSRMLADPNFLYKLSVEQAIGTVSVTVAELASRGEGFWKELDFVLCDWVITCISNFVAVWIVAPKLALAPPSSTASTLHLAGLLSSLPAHVFEPRNFSLAQRAATLAVRGLQYFTIGTLGGLLGTSLTYGLVRLKSLLAPSHHSGSDHKLPPLLGNSVTLGAFMAISSNPRYQLVNGVELLAERVLRPSPLLSAAFVAALRFANSVWGDVQWVQLSYILGLQTQTAKQPE
uniref:Uncharacterized protein n=1 Tax=Cyanoptyche gloeocystis TaxID=77922 RepID=A0A7S2JKM3_9EUKA|mmetsp:Transcript_1583/g.3007  ORF Transcript_1583/g.3007 Transcript_1583/m.3007 type:complete len:459 (+) Transcript_1583:130-1506(+)